MDYYSGGDLFDRMAEQGKISENECAIIIWQILSAVAYLHRKNIMHRDLKPENIVLEDQESKIFVKIIDFDNAVKFTKPVKGVVGTLEYMAPEILDSYYTEKCDIWSLGVLLYVLLSGNSPFGGSTDEIVKMRIKSGKFDLEGKDWKNISVGAKDLIKKMLVKSPEKRLSACSALRHPWVQTGNITEGKVFETLLRVKDFSNHNKAKEVLYTYILSHIIPFQQLQSLRLAFQQLDYNADGKLSKGEILFVLKSFMDFELAAETLNLIFLNGDSDRNGYLEYSEFLRAAIEHKNLISQENVEKAFLMIDTSGDGVVSYQEIKSTIGGDVSEFIMDEMIGMLDPKSSGIITLEQFKECLLDSNQNDS